MKRNIVYKQRYGKKIKQHLSQQSEFRRQLYQHIPARIFDIIVRLFFAHIIKKYDSIKLIDLPHITLTISPSINYKYNVNKKLFQYTKHKQYIPFSMLSKNKATNKKTPHYIHKYIHFYQ